VGAVIIEAPSMFQARVTAVVRRLAPGVPFGEGLTLSAEMIATIPPEEIGRMMSGVEAAELIPGGDNYPGRSATIILAGRSPANAGCREGAEPRPETGIGGRWRFQNPLEGTPAVRRRGWYRSFKQPL
jgi:hypothetical protein